MRIFRKETVDNGKQQEQVKADKGAGKGNGESITIFKNEREKRRKGSVQVKSKT